MLGPVEHITTQAGIDQYIVDLAGQAPIAVVLGALDVIGVMSADIQHVHRGFEPEKIRDSAPHTKLARQAQCSRKSRKYRTCAVNFVDLAVTQQTNNVTALNDFAAQANVGRQRKIGVISRGNLRGAVLCQIAILPRCVDATAYCRVLL